MDVEENPGKEWHENNNVDNGDNDGADWLPVVDAAVVVYQNNTWELENENNGTQAVHESQVFKVLTYQETVTTNENGRVHARHQVEELKVFVSNLIFICFGFWPIPMEVRDCHLNCLDEQEPLDRLIFVNFRKIRPHDAQNDNTS